MCAAILGAYANHFENHVHFDDFHTITNNPAIHSLNSIASFFVDARIFSILPTHASYRPLVSASLAFDYWMAGGLYPLAYGLTQMSKGNLSDAYIDFQHALEFNPAYSLLEVNLGVVTGALHQDAQAEQYFKRAIELAPDDSQSYSYYGAWLRSRGRDGDALAALNRAIALNSSDPAPRATLKLMAPPEVYLVRSLDHFRQAKFEECVRAAREAARLRPDYAEAHNNMAAGYQSLGRWDEAIAAAREALRLRPDVELARNSLRYELAQKALLARQRGSS